MDKLKKGSKHTIESRRKIVEARKKQVITEEHKRKISIKLKGRKPKFSVAGWNKGKENTWNKGKPRSEETKRKIGEAQMGEKNHAWRGGKKEYRCTTCGKIFEQYEYQVIKNNVRHCSRACSLRRGIMHHAWKGGITPLVRIIRNCPKYKKWRDDNFLRDNYTCVWCGARSGKDNPVIIHADHIKPFALIMKQNKIKTFQQALDCKELWGLSNGRTLCVGCHKQTPSYMYKKI